MLVPGYAHLDLVVIEAVDRIAMLSYGDGLTMGVASLNKQTVFFNQNPIDKWKAANIYSRGLGS